MPPKYKTKPDSKDKGSTQSRFSCLPSEKSLLSILLREGDEFWERAEDLNLAPSYFYIAQHRAFYVMIKSSFERHGQLSLADMAGLIPEEEMAEAGGLGYLAEIYSHEITPATWEHHAQKLIEAYVARTSYSLLEASLEELRSGSISPGDIVAKLADLHATVETPRPYVPMGRQGDAFVYYVPARGEIVTLAKNDHRTQSLLSLAPLSYWERRYGELKAESATNECFAAQGDRLFSPSSARGLGTWREGESIVYNAGDKVISYLERGEPRERPSYQGSIIYERKPPILHPHAEPLGNHESMAIAKYFKALPWAEREAFVLASGWLAISPLAGSLRFRPHAWINAPAGSGKSQLLDIYKHLLGSYALHVEGGTTEAGLRQALKLDARCGIFDEAEANGESGAKALERILSYLRSCSTSEGGHVLKGSVSGKAMISSPRSMFLFASIGNQLERASDESRFATLSLRKIHDKAKLTPMLERLASLRPALYAPHFAERLLARILSNAHTTLANIQSVRTYLIERGEPGRRADLMAPLLAGHFSLLSTKAASASDLADLYAMISSSQVSSITEPDEQRAFNHLLQYVTRDGLSIMELVERAWANQKNIDNCDEHAILKRHGLKIFREEGVLAVADSHPKLSEVFEKTDWTKGWGRILRNLPGARERCNVRLSASAHAVKTTKIPLPDMTGVTNPPPSF